MLLVVIYWLILALFGVKLLSNLAIPYRVLRLKDDQGLSLGFLLLGDVVLSLLIVVLAAAIDRPGLMYRLSTTLTFVATGVLGTYSHYFVVMLAASAWGKRERSKHREPRLQTVDDQLLCVLERLASTFAEERIGQLIVNVATLSRPPTPIRAIEATDCELRDSAIRREKTADTKIHAGLTRQRQEIIQLIRECWPREVPLGRWISEIAKKADTTLIHISDEELVEVLRSEHAP